MINKWKSAVIELDNMLLADTKKEFAETVQAGYGIDGNFAERTADFAKSEAVLRQTPWQVKSNSTSKKNPGWRMS